MKKINLILGLIACLNIYLSAEKSDTPYFYDNNIHFTISGNIIPIKPLTKFENGSSSSAYSVQDNYKISEEIKRVIIFTCWKFDNYNEYEIAIYNFDGLLLNTTERINGQYDILILKDVNRILFVQKALLVHSSDSYLYDVDGNLVKKIEHDVENRKTGHSLNEKYIWFVSFKMRDAKKGEELLYPSIPYIPYNHVMIFDSSNGTLVKDMNIESGGIVTVQINGTSIQIELPEADIPG